jgi:hypothetical protein
MPLIDKNHPLFIRAAGYNEHGVKMDTIREVNTEEGWIEMYVTYRPGANIRVVVIDRLTQELVKIRVHCGFEIRNLNTDEPLYTVTWSLVKGEGFKVKEYPENIAACLKLEQVLE